MNEVVLTLTWPEFFALRSLVAEHLLCSRRSEVYISVAPERGEVTHEQLLAKLLDYPPADPTSITCPRCGWTSYNPHDISERYCGHCHVFLDDPPAEEPPQ